MLPNSFLAAASTKIRQDNTGLMSKRVFAEKTIRLEGRPFSLSMFPMFDQIYNVSYPELLLKCGRQVGKTVTEQNLVLIESVAIPGFRHLYVSPSKDQTTRFSVSKLQKTLLASKDLKSILLNSDSRCNVFHHLYGNGSEVFLSYVGDSADRIRGISSDRNHYDEIQDIPYDGVIPVVNECLSKSPYKYITYAGTPKSNDNTIEYLWQISTQHEWAVRCHSCGNHSIYVNLAGLGKKGITCLKCSKYVNPYNGQWVAMNPTADITGFHIPQVILPENCPITAKDQKEFDLFNKNWATLKRKLTSGQYSETMFLNEVMGVSTSSGTRLLSTGDLESMATSSRVISRRPDEYYRKTNYKCVFAGVDWGGNGKEGTSRTALVIMALNHDNSIELLYYRIYPVENPLTSLDDIMEVCRRYQIDFFACDAGEGSLAIPIVREKFGVNNVFPMRYLRQRKMVEWDPILHQGCYKLYRTGVIDNFMAHLKKGRGVVYPGDGQCAPLFSDMLAIHEETTKDGNKIWNRHPKMPDDGLHAQVFAWVGLKIYTGDDTWMVTDSYSNNDIS